MEERMVRLARAVRDGDAAAVGAIVDENEEVLWEPIEYGSTILIIAARQGHLEIVRLLLARGADVHAWNRRTRVTALYEAASKGHLDVVILLLGHGATIGGRWPNALRTACWGGHLAIAERLLEHGGWQGDDECGLLACSPTRESTDVLKALLWAGLRCSDKEMRKVIDRAERRGHQECAKYLKWWLNETRRADLVNRARENVGAKYVRDETYLVLKPVAMPWIFSIFSIFSVFKNFNIFNKEKADEMDAMLTYVVRDMPTELYTELMEGLQLPGEVLKQEDWM